MQITETEPVPFTGYPTTFNEDLMPLPVDVEQSVLNERGLFVVRGLTLPIAGELINRSREEHIMEFCPNDANDRFCNIPSIRQWVKKGRIAFPLLSSEKIPTLAGFGWMGLGTPKQDDPQIEQATITFAFRLYRSALGNGNALPYMQTILGAHKEITGSNKGVWLETWGDNEKAIRTYERLGFEAVATVLGHRNNRQIPRVFMKLSDDR